MTTKEDIKQICQIYDNFRSERDVAIIAYNSDDTFWEHILATYNLSKPSLPSNLDEAAEKSYKEYDVKTAVKPKEHPVGFLFFDGFKAGAEWMAGQGVSVDGKVIMDFSEPYDIINRRLIAKLGDALLEVEPGEVIVQIRKKQ